MLAKPISPKRRRYTLPVLALMALLVAMVITAHGVLAGKLNDTTAVLPKDGQAGAKTGASRTCQPVTCSPDTSKRRTLTVS